jgi:nitrite reductase (NO-forming)
MDTQSERTRVGPSLLATLVVMALVVGALSLGVSVHKSTPEAVGATNAAPAAPAIPMGQPAPDGFRARDPKAPSDTEPAGTLHKVTLTVREAPVEIAPGVTQLMWTYNGTVPGPILRGKVGDRFEITVVNHGTMAHSIDFHSSQVAPNVTMRAVQPGRSILYAFTATHSGIFMYHCGTPPVLEHIAMGMYGAIIIDPPDLPPVAHEFVMVQSELYRAANASQPVDYTKLLDEQADAVVFNGYVNQYVDRPIRVPVNQTIRVWVMDDGPSDISSFHVIGTIFDTVYKEGAYLLRPDATHGGGQALDLTPAQGGFVEFRLPVPGTYPFVTHKFADAAKGAVGQFIAG